MRVSFIHLLCTSTGPLRTKYTPCAMLTQKEIATTIPLSALQLFVFAIAGVEFKQKCCLRLVGLPLPIGLFEIEGLCSILCCAYVARG